METNNQNFPNPAPNQMPQPSKKWYQHKALLAVPVLVILGASFWYFGGNKNILCLAGIEGLCNKEQGKQPNPGNQTKKDLPEGWKEYRHEVLGLSFGYPPEWGEIDAYNNNNITNLELLNKQYGDSTSITNKSISFGFSKSGPRIEIFSQKGGPTYLSPPYGPIDNLTSLTQTSNGCDYKINYQSGDRLQEIFSYCSEGAKVAGTEQEQPFNPSSFSPGTIPANGILYTYNLKYFGFKHLQNGSFDYLLTTYTATSTRQQANRLTGQEFLNLASVKNNSYPNFSEFTSFVNSFEAFPPPARQNPAFDIPAGEDLNITLIRRYYYLLLTGQLKEAYQLLQNPALLEDKFIAETRVKIYQVKPRDFKKLSPNRYEFWIDYQEQNDALKEQRAVVSIINGKIQQDLLETLTSKVAELGSTTAYGASRCDRSIVVIRQGDNETIIDSAPNDFDKTLETLIFYDVAFSPKGNYIIYRAGGWEWGFIR